MPCNWQVCHFKHFLISSHMNSCLIRWRAWAWSYFVFGFMQLWRWLTNENKQIILSSSAELKSQTDADWGCILWFVGTEYISSRWLKRFILFMPLLGILKQLSETWCSVCSQFYIEVLSSQRPVLWQQHSMFSVSSTVEHLSQIMNGALVTVLHLF